jgi:Cof subfamily protein (haloacid dehalogenase superfamily)
VSEPDATWVAGGTGLSFTDMDSPRLLAFDLDRTILTEDYRLPLRIEQAIREARDRGNLVTVLTGRPRAAALPYLEQLDIDGPYSVNHGAQVYGPDHALIRHTRLAAPLVGSVLEPYLPLLDLDFSCVVDDILYVRDPQDDRWAWAHTSNRLVKRFDPMEVLDADKVVFAADSRTERIEREILERHPDLITYLWGDGYLEVTGPDADKGGALRLISELLQVPREATVAFGDGLNDLTMVAWAGHGVAVGPYAHPGVVAAAAEQIAAPEDDGVALWLERNLAGAYTSERVEDTAV